MSASQVLVPQGEANAVDHFCEPGNVTVGTVCDRSKFGYAHQLGQTIAWAPKSILSSCGMNPDRGLK